jgi:glycosyltransferase EpsD
MKKKILITSTDLMMIQFLIPHVINISECGFDVEIACSEVGNRMNEVREKLKDFVNAIYIVRLRRSPVSIINIKGYFDMKQVVENGNYDVIWTNEPVMGVVTRLASRKVRKKGTKVIYMVHGFHFYKGAPLSNWFLFYPIEKFAGHFCDSVTTMNMEDYRRAKRMRLPDVKYIHGIGMNPDRIDSNKKKSDIRKELGLKEDEKVILSVGELSKRKNQRTVINAVAQMKDGKIHYVLCGKGDQFNNLKQQASKLGLEDRIHFLGYRKDIIDICCQADVFAMPSYHEGLPVAALEAMYCGTPIVSSNIRGLEDIIKDGENGFLCNPDDSNAFSEKILLLLNDKEISNKFIEINKEKVLSFCIQNIKEEVLNLFE